MNWLKQIFSKRRRWEELSESIREHLEEKIDDLMEGGMSREEAMNVARRDFGNVTLIEQRSRDVWQDKFVTPVVSDVKFGWAQLRKSPIFTLTAILILAIGIGANTAVFSLLYAITVRDLPVHNPSELAFIQVAISGFKSGNLGTSYPVFDQLRRQQQSFNDVCAWTLDRVFILDDHDALRSVNASMVTGNTFDLLGVSPTLGRMLAPSDDRSRGPADPWPVVLSYTFWKENFRGNPSIVGKTITVSGSPAVIVGVAPRMFEGIVVGLPSRVFLPLHFIENLGIDEDPNFSLRSTSNFRFLAIGRLRSEFTLSQADTEINGYTQTVLLPMIPKNTGAAVMLRDATLRVASARHGLSRLTRYRGPLASLQAIMGGVLFLCCFNVTGLQLARISARRHELALRIALGAHRWQVMRQLFIEAALLAIIGAILAAFVSWGSTSLLSSFLTGPGWAESTVIHPDWSVFAIAGLIAALTTLGVGVLPAFFAGKPAPGPTLNTRSSLQRGPTLGGRILVPVQIALSFVLVVVTGLMISTLLRLRGEDMGFRVDHVIEVSAQFQTLKKTPSAIMDLYRSMVHQLRGEPGVESAAVTWITPMTGFDPQANVRIANNSQDLRIAFNQVGPGYFETLQISLVSGRDFGDGDRTRNVCIVNQAAEKLLYGDATSLDGELQVSYNNEFSNILCRIVGVVQDVKYANLRGPEEAILYLPITADSILRGSYRNNMVFLMRSGTDQIATTAYRRVLANFAPETPFMKFLPLRTQMDQALGSERLLCLMCVLFGGVALPLCGIGIFGLLATRVELHTTEIAVRIALGASRAQIIRKVLRESMLLLVTGLLLGIPALFFVAKFTQSFLYETSPMDPHNIANALMLLLAVAVASASVPGWRAANLDPLQILRRE